MLNTSVVLGPTVDMTMRGVRGTSGSAFSLCRSMSNVAVSSQSPYFLSFMGLFSKQREREESDKGGESSGAASGTAYQGQSGKRGFVSSGRKNQTVRTARRWDSGHRMHISDQQQGQCSGMEVDSSRAMVEDYVRHSLEQARVPWESGQRDVTPNDIQRAMRSLGDQLENTIGERLDGMIDRLQFSPENGQAQLTTTMEELFADGEINWGRIAVLVKFAGKLSAHCVRDLDKPQLVHSVLDWVSHYIDTHLTPWIAQNNGWAGFVKFHEEKKQSGFSSLRRLLTVGVAAAGLLTLGALFRS